MSYVLICGRQESSSGHQTQIPCENVVPFSAIFNKEAVAECVVSHIFCNGGIVGVVESHATCKVVVEGVLMNVGLPCDNFSQMQVDGVFAVVVVLSHVCQLCPLDVVLLEAQKGFGVATKEVQRIVLRGHRRDKLYIHPESSFRVSRIALVVKYEDKIYVSRLFELTTSCLFI